MATWEEINAEYERRKKELEGTGLIPFIDEAAVLAGLSAEHIVVNLRL